MKELKLYSNIKKYRLMRKLSQDTLADLMGYSDKSMISKIEKGKVDLGIKKIMEFANVLKVPPDVLLGFSEVTDAYYEADPITQQNVCAVLGVRRERE